MSTTANPRKRAVRIEVGADAGVGIRLTGEGPMVVDIRAALAEAAARGYFRR